MLGHQEDPISKVSLGLGVLSPQPHPQRPGPGLPRCPPEAGGTTAEDGATDGIHEGPTGRGTGCAGSHHAGSAEAQATSPVWGDTSVGRMPGHVWIYQTIVADHIINCPGVMLYHVA